MRHMEGSPARRRMALLAACAIVLALVAAPAAAFAAVPHSTISTTYMYMPVAKTFTIAGRIAASTHGKKITIEIRKPGRTFWTTVRTVTIGSTGRWKTTYFPRLGGKFYVRARYGSTDAGLSRTASVIVRKGPGVTYTITLASTTSTRDSRLFDALRPMFLAACPEYSLKATFVGSGAAMAIGGLGDADVLLTHSPAAEVDFMHGIVAGVAQPHHGVTRFKVMYNDFVLIGPKANPAGVTMDETPANAFKAIADAGSTFISRADNSGTNAKEKEIWASLGNPQTGKSWYKASKMGMAQAIQAADQQGGYTLADRGTWLTATSLGTTGTLVIENAGSSVYYNQYAVIEVSGARNAEGAQDFRRWIMTPAVQKVIGEFGQDSFPGQKLFTGNAGPYPW